mgnify:CR=1 FL=1
MKNVFRKAATKVSNLAGTAYVFLAAVAIVIIWAITGPIFNYSDTWQLVINTGTTIVTFLMVFLIQNTQNRDSRALQIKLDELIRATKGARMSFVNLEELSDDDVDYLNHEFHRMSEKPAIKRAIAKLHQRIDAEQDRRQDDDIKK